jgi:CheY-like chemotaxis protein
LTVIGGYCDLLLSQTSEDSPWREQLKEVRNAANRAETLTGSLLSFSRKRILQPEVININDVLQGIAKPMASMMGDDVELTMALEEDLATTELDQSGLEQALMNLVANARDAMPAGGKLHIETENVELTESYVRLHPDAPPGPYVLLVVSDTGVGMDKAMLDRIFEPFYTTKERGKGTGLGLSMVYGFVKQSGGAIHVYSEPGKGTTFKMYFPRRKAVSESKPAQPETEEKRPPGKETVLLVEDDELVRHLARRVLRQSGYTLLEAADPAEAKSIAKTHEGEIDLLLSDVVMPQGSGPELAEQLLEDRPNMKVLLMSGYTAEVIDRHGLSRLGADLLPKPFSTTALAQAVRRMLDTGTVNAGKH